MIVLCTTTVRYADMNGKPHLLQPSTNHHYVSCVPPRDIFVLIKVAVVYKSYNCNQSLSENCWKNFLELQFHGGKMSTIDAKYCTTMRLMLPGNLKISQKGETWGHTLANSNLPDKQLSHTFPHLSKDYCMTPFSPHS